MPRAPVGLQDRFYAPRGWTWSGLNVGDEVWRYGVASPPSVPHGSVLIVSGGDDPAEVWFETANDLIGKGYAVWVLQARPSVFTTDAVRRMARDVVRPRAGQPLVVVGDGLGADAVLDSLQIGAPGNAIILQGPVTIIADQTRWLAPDKAEAAAGWAAKLHLGGLKLPRKAVASPAEPDLDQRRAALAGAWERADPALSPPAPTWGWLDRDDRTARRGAAMIANPAHTPVEMADETGALGLSCARIAGCEDRRDIGQAGQRQIDPVRGPWLAEIVGLLERYRTARP